MIEKSPVQSRIPLFDFRTKPRLSGRGVVIGPNSEGNGFGGRFRIEILTAGPVFRWYMSDSTVDADEVRHVADLARVDLAEAELERFAEQFGEILDAFETLEEVPEVEREADLVNVMRPDEVRDSLDQEQALQNAPEDEEGFFKGPKVS